MKANRGQCPRGRSTGLRAVSQSRAWRSSHFLAGHRRARRRLAHRSASLFAPPGRPSARRWPAPETRFNARARRVSSSAGAPGPAGACRRCRRPRASGIGGRAVDNAAIHPLDWRVAASLAGFTGASAPSSMRMSNPARSISRLAMFSGVCQRQTVRVGCDVHRNQGLTGAGLPWILGSGPHGARRGKLAEA